MKTVRKTVLHLFGAMGGGAKGFKRAQVDVAGMHGEWQCLGSIDIDAKANRVFAHRVGVPALDLDLASRQQYIAIKGHEPPPGWREATPADIRLYAGHRRPDCIFLSAPCKGFSGLLPEAKSVNPKYQAMNGLAQRALWLVLEAWADDPVPMVLFENVQRLLTRGRQFVDQCVGMLRAYRYLARETVHDCGELGGLGQSRKRCLIVARHAELVPNFLYEPPKRPLRSVGEVIGRLWLPGDGAGGPMHRVPRLQWKTWVRLAFVEAGSDWRSLNRLAVQDGQLRDYLIVPGMHNGGLGVRRWNEPCGTVQSQSRPTNGAFSIADPRFAQSEAWNDGHAYGVRRWDQTSSTVTAKLAPGSGYGSVADPRHHGPAKHSNEFRVVAWAEHAMAVKGAHGTGQCVADPRAGGGFKGNGKYRVTAFDEPAGAVLAASTTGQGAFAVADPRSGMAPERSAYLTGGHYGVLPWSAPSGAVSAAACHDNGRWSIADPRLTDCPNCKEGPVDRSPDLQLPAAGDQLVAMIRSLDDTWHRPFTTLELAALQSLFDPEDPADVLAFTDAMTVDTLSDSQHREWIGNAVPPDASEVIAVEILRTLLLADAGETFALSAAPIWVRPYVAGLQLAQGDAV